MTAREMVSRAVALVMDAAERVLMVSRRVYSRSSSLPMNSTHSRPWSGSAGSSDAGGWESVTTVAVDDGSHDVECGRPQRCRVLAAGAQLRFPHDGCGWWPARWRWRGWCFGGYLLVVSHSGGPRFHDHVHPVLALSMLAPAFIRDYDEPDVRERCTRVRLAGRGRAMLAS